MSIYLTSVLSVSREEKTNCEKKGGKSCTCYFGLSVGRK